MIVCLDAGHGGSDPGAVNANLGIAEKNLTLRIVGLLRDTLNRRGISVVVTRDCDIYVPLSARCRVANSALADLFVSVHINASPKPEAHGIETWYYAKSAQGANFARAVHAEIRDVYSTLDRGVKASQGFYVLKYTHMPAILVECGFITNDADVTELSKESVLADLASAIADGIISFSEKS